MLNRYMLNYTLRIIVFVIAIIVYILRKHEFISLMSLYY
jgi:hypothetical protein